MNRSVGYSLLSYRPATAQKRLNNEFRMAEREDLETPRVDLSALLRVFKTRPLPLGLPLRFVGRRPQSRTGPFGSQNRRATDIPVSEYQDTFSFYQLTVDLL